MARLCRRNRKHRTRLSKRLRARFKLRSRPHVRFHQVPELREMVDSGLIDPLRNFSEACRAEAESLQYEPPD
jgi:hypothetical protein